MWYVGHQTHTQAEDVCLVKEEQLGRPASDSHTEDGSGITQVKEREREREEKKEVMHNRYDDSLHQIVGEQLEDSKEVLHS